MNKAKIKILLAKAKAAGKRYVRIPAGKCPITGKPVYQWYTVVNLEKEL